MNIPHNQRLFLLQSISRAQKAVTGTVNGVIYTTRNEIVNNADKLSKGDLQTTKAFILEKVSSSLLFFAKFYSVDISPEVHFIWTISIADFLRPDLLNGEIFKKPVNFQEIKMEDMPPSLFQSMIVFFNPKNHLIMDLAN